ncbi:hypothetical protein [Acinetobacter vivianii]|uniref:hypothetical protein n=1 Tax=Acinetobacter vivianii TaxID=1776742 RepID=UPI003D082BCF
METALDIVTNLLIDAEDLWELEGNVDKDRYRCPGCGVKVSPASYLRDENLKRPYFLELHKTDPHKDDCDIAGEKKLKAKARKQKVFSENSILPSFIPTSLKLIDTRIKTGDESKEKSLSSNSQIKNDSISTEGNGIRRSTGTAQNIRRLCQCYINYPNDRDLPLNLPNIGKSTYGKLFSHIPNKKIVTISTSRILLAPMQFSEPKISDTEIIIELSRGIWNDDFTKLIEKYSLIVDISNWSKAKKTMFKRELELVRRQAIHTNNKKKNKTWVFFLGEQDAHDLSKFYVEDHRLVCAIFVEDLK